MKRIVFIQDFFTGDVVGGAEMSIQAHIDTCQYPYIKLHTKTFRFNQIRKDDFIVFGNFYNFTSLSILEGFKDYNYVIEECDYKYCRYRSSHLHRLNTLKDCDCPTTYSAPIVDFMLHAKHLFWKSEAQRDIYYNFFPELKAIPSDIMGGVFTDEQLYFILSLKDIPQDDYYFVLKTKRWIKGYRESVAYCVKNDIKYRAIEDLPYKESLMAMAKSKGIVYMPAGYDVSCRMITEMKLLGRDIITSNKVQHMTEAWFNSGEAGMLGFLRSRNKVFWERIDGLQAGLVREYDTANR
jgi:hypothetical protein